MPAADMQRLVLTFTDTVAISTPPGTSGLFAFELGQFVIDQARYLGVRKAAEDEIHLAGTAMPATEQKPLAAVVEAAA